MPRKSLTLILLGLGFSAFTLLGQAPVAPAEKQEVELPPGRVAGGYVLGPNDVIMLRVLELEEVSDKPFRVDSDGNVNIPLLGKIQVGGMSIEKLEGLLNERFKPYVRKPQVIINIVQFRSEPVFLVGSFRSPGVYPLQGRRTLIDLLTAVGGLQPGASRRLRITRRLEYGRIPLANAVDNDERQVSEVEISLSRLMETVNPEEDLVLKPYDVIKAPPREMVYVSGAVGRAGPIELQDRDSLSVTQVISMTGGLAPYAKPEKAMVLRPILDTAKRAEVPVDVKKIMAGKANDFPLLPNDVLVIPSSSAGKWSVVGRVAMYAVPALASALIYVAVR
ncbi:MAG: polysaccharide export protein [Acidobacteriales bacterium]|nr:polysaccharide export protein [Terriglobales bacterium]